MSAYIAATCLLLSWLMPLHFPPWVSWHSEVLAFIGMLVLAWTGLLRGRKFRPEIPVPAAALPFLALTVIAFVQLAGGLITFRGDALVVAFYLLLCVACISLGFASAQPSDNAASGVDRRPRPHPLTVLACTVAVGAFASAIVAFAQAFELFESAAWISRMPDIRRPGANLGQPNQLATLQLMGIASLLYFYETRTLSAYPAALASIVLCTALAAAESRTGVLGFCILSAWCLVGTARAGLRIRPWVIVAFVVAFLGLFWAWPLLMSTTAAGFVSGARVDTQAGLRVIVWPQLLEAVTLKPWFGWGFEGVSKAHNAVVSAYPLSEPYSYSHNLIIDAALDLGLPIAAILVLSTVVWAVPRLRSVRSLQPWYSGAAILPVAVHSMLEFPFAYAYFLAPVMFLVGYLDGFGSRRPWLTARARPIAAGVLLATLAGAWSVVEYLQTEEDFRVARFEWMQIGVTPSEYVRPKIFLLTQLDAMLEVTRLVPSAGMSPDDIERAKQVALRYPWTATQNRYALALALNGNPDEALRQLQVMKTMHGEAVYSPIRANWKELASTKYPALARLDLP